MRHLINIRKGINKITDTLTIIMIVVMVIVVAAQVFFRYVLSDSLSWSEELARYLFIWVTFLGADFTLRHKAHMGIDSLLKSLNGIKKLILSLFIDIVLITFAIIVLISGMELTQQTINQYSSALSVPIGLVYLAIPVSMVLITMNVLYEMIQKVLGRSADASSISENQSLNNGGNK